MERCIRFAVMLCLLMAGVAQASEQPNVIVIMTDDMGYSDVGCYGSEIIRTPHLDGLAERGLRFSQFYNTSRCCPTRASLMTGLYAHQAGVGAMTGDAGPNHPGYRGRLMDRCVTIAEALQPAGYRTIMTGKWHLGDRKQAWWPPNRGFERSYFCPQGGGFYFRPSSWSNRSIARGNEVLFDDRRDPPQGWYATDAFTDEGLAYVEEAVGEGKPFFWYLAYNAPHFPLQAKPDDIAKYRGRFKEVGWDKLRERRHQNLVELGMIDHRWPLSPRDRRVPAWDTLTGEQQDEQDQRMAIYAAMIDCVDQNVGKIVAKLTELGELDNTLILFLHDNGGAAVGGHLGSSKGKGEPGTATSTVFYGTCWANVSDTPFREYKRDIEEGGIATPLIAHWPEGTAPAVRGTIAHDPGHVIDIMPTCLAMAGAPYPSTRDGHEIIPAEGTSLLPVLRGEPLVRGAPLFFEHLGNRGMRDGRWKIVAAKGKPWQLFDLEADRTELNNLADAMPDKVQAMADRYDAWAERCFVRK